MTDFVLRRAVTVSPAAERDLPPGSLYEISAGTALEDIPESELAQLSPDHFESAADPDARPDDWRTDAAVLEHDARQAETQAAEAEERAARKAEANAAAEEG